MFQKDMNISLLLDFYGDTLSERRLELMEMYYNEDLSLSEIAEIAGISRQGVRDSVKKSEKELLALEEKLGLAKRFKSIESVITGIIEEIDDVAAGSDDTEVKERLKAISQELETIEF